MSYRSLIFILLFLFGIDSYSQSMGVMFNGQAEDIEERTSLVLFEKNEFNTSDHFRIEFDFALHNGYGVSYGYIFRLLSRDNQVVDLVYENKLDVSTINLLIGDSILSLPVSREFLMKWRHVVIDFNIAANAYSLSVGNFKKEINEPLFTPNKIGIWFGVNHNNLIQTIESARFKLKNVDIIRKGKSEYFWSLKENSGDYCKDTIKGKEAEIRKPKWLGSCHQNWELIDEIKMSGYAQMTFDKKTNRFLVVSKDALLKFHTGFEIAESQTQYKQSLPFKVGYQIFTHPLNGRISTYSVYNQKITNFNQSGGTWSDNISFRKDYNIDFWHNNKFINPLDSSFNVIFGYGHFTYKNKMFNIAKNDKEQYGKWQVAYPDNNIATPRYMAGCGLGKENKVYFFGGFGSKTGEQKMNPHYCKELLEFDLKTKVFKRKHDYSNSGMQDFCSANSIIVRDNDFYALVFSKFKFNTELQLVKGSFDDDSLITVGSKIPILFKDINSFVDLAYSDIEEKLFAMISVYDSKANKTSFKVYSILFPPQQFSGNLKSKQNLKDLSIIWYLLIPGILIVFVVLYFNVVKKRRKYLSSNNIDVEAIETEVEVATKEVHNNEENQIKNCIHLYGNFSILDKSGKELSVEFTPLLKEMFFLILLYSINKEKGVSISKMNDILWFDKSYENARNNRSVNVTKLRKLLKDIEGIKLIQSKGFCLFEIDKNLLYFDYLELYEILNGNIVSNDFVKLQKITDIVKNGMLLHNYDFEWLDDFKSKATNDISNMMFSVMEVEIKKEYSQYFVDATDALLIIDPINEEALKIKCKSLIVQGRHSMAKECYNHFISLYKKLYNEDYSIEFQDLIKC